MSARNDHSFRPLQDPLELIGYLSDSGSRLKNALQVHHYTNLDSFLKMMSSRKWKLSNILRTNDRMEGKQADEGNVHDFNFISFMLTDSESIGMWQMYSQPQIEGVRISIPRQHIRRWASEDEAFSLGCVAYSNRNRVNSASAERLFWSNKTNENIKDATCSQELIGYIKDEAWSYEKEIRLIYRGGSSTDERAIYLDIPNYVIENMTVTLGPFFDSDASIMSIDPNRIQKSRFTGLLMASDPCEKCTRNR